MRSKLVFLILAVACLQCAAADLLYSAKSTAEIRKWGEKNGLSSRFVELQRGTKNVSVLITDSGSGLCIETAYLYAKTADEWGLKMIRFCPSSASAVVVGTNKTSVTIRTKEGTSLVEVPFEGL